MHGAYAKSDTATVMCPTVAQKIRVVPWVADNAWTLSLNPKARGVRTTDVRIDLCQCRIPLSTPIDRVIIVIKVLTGRRLVRQNENSFDEYSDNIRETGAQSFKTTPAIGPWQFSLRLLDKIILQFGCGGAGAIVHGITCNDAFYLFKPISEGADRVVFEGRKIKWTEFVLLPPACPFTFVTTGPLDWITLSVPIELARSAFKKHLGVEYKKTLILPSALEATRFVAVAKMLWTSMQNERAKQRINLQKRLETSLLRMLRNILSNSFSEQDDLNSPIERLMSGALRRIGRDSQVRVAELANAVGVSERTLHRAFKKYLEIGPKRYLKIRQLNIIRHAIRQPRYTPVNVTDILTEHGVTEFGRFAFDYKALFGEAPAETLQRYLIRPSSEGGIQLQPANALQSDLSAMHGKS